LTQTIYRMADQIASLETQVQSLQRSQESIRRAVVQMGGDNFAAFLAQHGDVEMQDAVHNGPAPASPPGMPMDIDADSQPAAAPALEMAPVEPLVPDTQQAPHTGMAASERGSTDRDADASTDLVPSPLPEREITVRIHLH
jgi:hypothetical protein